MSLLAKNLIFTTLLVVMLYKVRKPGTLALFVLVNMLISMLLLGGSVTLLPAMLLAAGCAEAAMACSEDAEAVGARARRRGIRSHVESLFAVRFVAVHARESGLVVCHRPHCGHRLRGIAVRAFSASAPFGSCVMQALSVTEGGRLGRQAARGGYAGEDVRQPAGVRGYGGPVRGRAADGAFGMSLVYALGMRQFRILLIGYAVLVGMSLLAMGCAFGMSLLIPSMPAFFGGVAGGAVPAHGDDAERDPAAGLFLPGAEPADRPEEFAPAVLPVSPGGGDDPFHPHVFA